MIPGAMDLDDYIMGSLMLYVDIIRMFIYILAIFGKGK
jgi:FtsH-binding integral membrane protein